MSARLSCPSWAGAGTDARYSVSVNFVIAADLALGLTVTEMFRAMAYPSAASAMIKMINRRATSFAVEFSALVSAPTRGAADRI
jgi:hypothetical protein